MQINTKGNGLYAMTYATESSHDGKFGVLADWRRYDDGRFMWTVSGGFQHRAVAIGWAGCPDPLCDFRDAPWPLHTVMILGENIAAVAAWLHRLPQTAPARLRALVRRS